MKIKAALCAVLLGLGSSSAWAQMVVPLDLMPPYEAARIVRSAGLVPIARPTRWGASYVVPAIDRLGNTVRVMVDGRYGDILAVRTGRHKYARRTGSAMTATASRIARTPSADKPDASRCSALVNTDSYSIISGRLIACSACF